MTADSETIAQELIAGLDRLIAAADENEPEPDPQPDPKPDRPALPSRRLLTGHGWSLRYLDPIELVGGDWKASYALAMPIVSSGGILILHGKRGAGKTRLAAEIARAGDFPRDQVKGGGPAGSAPEPKRTPLYRTAMEFFLDVRATYGKRSETTEKQVIEQLASAGLLVIDELQERGESAFEDRLLTHLIDRRYREMLPTILIANLTKAELGPALGPSILDRYAECGRRIEFTWDSYRRNKP